jgi:hypothetical protein
MEKTKAIFEYIFPKKAPQGKIFFLQKNPTPLATTAIGGLDGSKIDKICSTVAFDALANQRICA